MWPQSIRKIIDQITVYAYYSKQPLKYSVVKYNTLLRHNKIFRIFDTIVKGIFIGVFLANISQIQVRFNRFEDHHMPTQYEVLIKNIKNQNTPHQTRHIIMNLINKGQQRQLTPIQILMLTQLTNMQELKVHGQYLASIK